MLRSAVAELPLHPGRAPPWLFKRMVALAREIFRIMVDELSPRTTLERLADPFWFQALSMLLGFDWHSSGTTTVTCGALSEALSMEEHGIAVLGGKGGRMRKVPPQIDELVRMDLLDADPEYLKNCSRMVAKVDTAAVQDGYPLYHHTFFVDERGEWAVVQQGMNSARRMARRYHWISSTVMKFTEEPHVAIVGDGRHSWVLDLTSTASQENKRAILDMVREGLQEVREGISIVRNYMALSGGGHTTLETFSACVSPEGIRTRELPPFYLQMPLNVDWDAVKRLYDTQPQGFDDLLGVKGVGPSLVRSLSLTAQLVYGEPPSWRDPIKYSFAVGGKDGVPYPVDRRTYDRTIEVLRDAIDQAKVGRREKIMAIKRLKDFTSENLIGEKRDSGGGVNLWKTFQ